MRSERASRGADIPGPCRALPVNGLRAHLLAETMYSLIAVRESICPLPGGVALRTATLAAIGDTAARFDSKRSIAGAIGILRVDAIRKER